MKFTVTLKNTLTNTEYTFEEPFTLNECFDDSQETFDQLVKALNIKNPDHYESTEDLIDDFSTCGYTVNENHQGHLVHSPLDQYIDIIRLEDFGTNIDITNTTYHDINDLYDLNEDIDKIKAYKEYQGSIKVSEILDTNWDNVYLYKSVTTEKELGIHFVYELSGGVSEMPRKTLEDYFDYDKYGRDCSLNGAFTKEGFIEIY